jgi:hypothetical protein
VRATSSHTVAKYCLRSRWMSVLTVSTLVPSAFAACSYEASGLLSPIPTNPGVPNRTYAGKNNGYVAGGTTLIYSAGQLTFFPNATITGLVSYSFGGTVIVKRDPLTGTFKVNGDGSVSGSVTNTKNETVNFDLYPTPDGNTFTLVETDPGTIVNGIWTRGR